MESPRMGPNLPYKPATPNRKTSHTRTSRSRKTSHTHISQIRKTSLPRTTRSSLFPLIIIHVRRYGESSRGPYHPWGRACARVCVSDCLGRRGAPSVADRQEDRKTGRQGGQPDTPSRTGRARASPDLTSHARLPCPTLPTQPHFSPCPPTLPADLSRLPTLPPFLPCPHVSYCQQERHTRNPQNGLLSSPFTIFRFIKTLHADTQQLACLLNIISII